ncbi:MATE family efflux transporter [Devosia sp.]|uniref:MATE family efflux transporter n=1 Tax=Devosia sp. TaxID=1871048 RepID=UPI003BAC676A
MSNRLPANPYTSGSIPRMFVRTAIPIIALTSISGLLSVVDAIFLGAFVGPNALEAVTLMFPFTMLLVALVTMVSTGMSSVLGRLIGGGKLDEARRVFAGAHGLSLTISLALIALFVAVGGPVAGLIAGGSTETAGMGQVFIGIWIFFSPAVFLLAVHSDALRVEGRVGFMAATGLAVSIANVAFNYALIVWFGLGVAGSALGTGLAQLLALLAILLYRRSGKAVLSTPFIALLAWRAQWREILELGLPRSLSFLGISLGAAAIIAALRVFGGQDTDASIAAYGVLTRILSFAYFPLLGISLALQAMVGNNYGAGLWARSNASLKLALLLSFGYACAIEIILVAFSGSLGWLFVADPVVVAAIARILPPYVALYVTFGPAMIITGYLQSIGDAKGSAILALSRTYLFAVPLTFLLPILFGENGIWFAAPIADCLVVMVMAALLARQPRDMEWGLFKVA